MWVDIYLHMYIYTVIHTYVVGRDLQTVCTLETRDFPHTTATGSINTTHAFGARQYHQQSSTDRLKLENIDEKTKSPIESYTAWYLTHVPVSTKRLNRRSRATRRHGLKFVYLAVSTPRNKMTQNTITDLNFKRLLLLPDCPGLELIESVYRRGGGGPGGRYRGLSKSSL